MDWQNILILTQKELRDVRRNRWFVLYTLAFAGLALALSWLGLAGVGQYGLAGFGRTGASLINLVLLIVPLMGLTLGAMGLATERERGTLLYLLAQPVTTTELLWGKFFGLALGLFATLAFGFGLSGLAIAWLGSLTEISTYLLLVLLAFGLGLVTLSLGFLISVTTQRAASAVGVALFVWLTLVFFGDLGLMGTAIVLKMSSNQLFFTVLANPLQVFKVAAVLNLRQSLEILGPAGTYALQKYGQALWPILTGILLAWVVIPMGLSQAIFNRRGGVN